MQNYPLRRKASRSKFKNVTYFGFLIVIFSFSFLIPNLNKAEAFALSLSIDPPIISINAIPPTIITSPLIIQNESDAQVRLQIQIKPFMAKGENGELEYLKEPLEISNNIQILDGIVPVENITLGPNQQKSLDLKINLPQNTTIFSLSSPESKLAGGRTDYYFSIVFVSINTPAIKSNSSVNQIGIATNVLLSIGPMETPKAVLEEFSSNIFFEKGPVPFVVRIKNEGPHFIKPKGEIIIKNMLNQSIGKLDLTNVNILSNSIRAIPNDVYMQELRLKDNLGSKAKSALDFKRPIVLWKESFLLGLYTATLNMSMSDEGPTVTKSIRFFAFPFQILIIIAIIVIAVIIIRNRLKFYANKNRA